MSDKLAAGIPLGMESVACRSIANKDGNGAVGCGKGWTQVRGLRRSCPTCKRPLSITDQFWQVELPRKAK